MSSVSRAWLESQPVVRQIGSVTMVHGSPRDPLREYVASVGVARANLAELATTYGLHGHTHVPVAFIDDAPRLEIVDPEAGAALALDERATLVNPGSVGQPRDGDPRASYLLLDTDELTVTWRRVAYDIPAVQAAIHAAGLPRRLADRLAVGQ
jgi:diadenosine tetraphosphatase ApaH/serine/threonine PP2A family protein phosphatase